LRGGLWRSLDATAARRRSVTALLRSVTVLTAKSPFYAGNWHLREAALTAANVTVRIGRRACQAVCQGAAKSPGSRRPRPRSPPLRRPGPSISPQEPQRRPLGALILRTPPQALEPQVLARARAREGSQGGSGTPSIQRPERQMVVGPWQARLLESLDQQAREHTHTKK
jgi:hypothetical protein